MTPTGTITLVDVQTEFGGATPIGLGEYYAGFGYVPAGTVGVPLSGAISMDNLRGKSGISYGTLAASTSSIVEGGTSVTFTLSGGVGIPSGTYYWRLEGTNITATDFASLTGSFSVTSNTGSFSVSALNESAYEGTESFRAVIGSASGVPSVFKASAYVSITEGATYSVSNPTSVNEGSSISFTITTTNVANGNLYYSLDAVSGTINSSDLSSGTITGTVPIASNSAVIPITVRADTTTEGAETFKFNLRTGSTSGTIVAFGPTVTINDTSVAAPTYAFSFSPTSIAEGGLSTWTLSTTNVTAGTTLYFTDTTGTASPTLDTIGGVASGTIVTAGNTTTGSVWAAYDALTESSETFINQIRTGSISGTVVATATLTITQAFGVVTTLVLTYTGGVNGAATTLSLQITSIPAYNASRTFAVTYVVNGQAETNAGQVTTSLVVPAMSTSSVKTLVWSRNPANLLASSLFFYLRLAGHTAKASNTLSGIYV